MKSVRALCGAVVVAAFVAGIAGAHAQAWPTRPIRVISPFPAGSASDTTSRVVLGKLQEILGQPMVVENKAGAGGVLGFADVAKADPDGYTLVTSSTSMATGQVLHSHLPYDPLNDFVPVVMLGSQPNVLVASKQSGFLTVADLVAAATAKPGTLTFASAGIGSTSHMAGERFRLATKIDVRHIPFRENGLDRGHGWTHRLLFHSAGGSRLGALNRQAHRARGQHGEALAAVAGRADGGGSRLSRCRVRTSGSGYRRRRRRPPTSSPSCMTRPKRRCRTRT